jgi:hypothetical protein
VDYLVGRQVKVDRKPVFVCRPYDWWSLLGVSVRFRCLWRRRRNLKDFRNAECDLIGSIYRSGNAFSIFIRRNEVILRRRAEVALSDRSCGWPTCVNPLFGHRCLSQGLLCANRVAKVFLQHASRRRGDRTLMWEAPPPCAQLAGDSGNAIAWIGDVRSFRFFWRKISRSAFWDFCNTIRHDQTFRRAPRGRLS